MQDILRRLRPIALDSLGLESALQELCESWEEQTGIACGFFPSDVPDCLHDSTAIAIFRLVQEALTNVTRHAGPRHDERHADFDLIGMRERVAALQGNIGFFSEPGCGLCIAVELPAPRNVSES